MTSGQRSLTTPRGELVYTITHRPRITRRMHLEIDENGELLVVVPRDWPPFYTQRLLRKHLAYVQRFLDRARQRQHTPVSYSNGSNHLFAGDVLTLHVHSGRQRRARFERTGDQLHIELADPGEARIRSALQDWYRERAQAIFPRRLDVFQQRAAWARERKLTLRLRRMKRTWGTCSNKGVIRLNTHLVKAPEDCLDYVISHELCHLQEMNHGPGFYRLQNELWPDWRRYRRHLREHGHRYTQE